MPHLMARLSPFFPTKHAIALKNAKGVDVLIHVGIDTVELKGQGFEQLVKAGDTVKQGQPLLRIDLELIGSKGYSLVTPFVVTNSSEQLEIIVNDNKEHITQHDVALVIL